MAKKTVTSKKKAPPSKLKDIAPKKGAVKQAAKVKGGMNKTDLIESVASSADIPKATAR